MRGRVAREGTKSKDGAKKRDGACSYFASAVTFFGPVFAWPLPCASPLAFSAPSFGPVFAWPGPCSPGATGPAFAPATPPRPDVVLINQDR